MPTFDASAAECHVFTFKEGLLSKVAHDLKLEVKEFEVQFDEASISARFDAASFGVVCVMKRGQPKPGTLKDKDKSDILQYLAQDVLQVHRYPEITFQSTEVTRIGSSVRVAGMLDLHGQKRRLSVLASSEGGRLVARVKVHQPDFGIKPFKALLGAIKVKPDVEVVLSIPAPQA
ncbi:MAG: YceI family protein [Proteobacteria bacterium]|jgi:hypothetical protein|nr:YceI family protein [Pseudomonadota bacterium]